jgi:serine/threonine protein kinase
MCALAAGDRLGRYELVDRLGAGSMGEVWTANDPELGRKVAIKVLRDELAVESERLRAEARAMAQLGHPGVVAVHDVGEASGRVFVAMELVDGTSVRAWLATPRPWRDVVATFIAAGGGLAAAHAAGLVHAT